jgi:hypothetical protein
MLTGAVNIAVFATVHIRFTPPIGLGCRIQADLRLAAT